VDTPLLALSYPPVFSALYLVTRRGGKKSREGITAADMSTSFRRSFRISLIGLKSTALIFIPHVTFLRMGHPMFLERRYDENI
jgi:hypothetical protein